MMSYFNAIPVLLVMSSLGWLYASSRKNVNIVDSLWSLFFLMATLVYIGSTSTVTASSVLLLILVALWSIRLSVHLSLRNAHKPEDHRYANMRAENPHFTRQSLVKVFGLQALLAWIISMPLAAAILNPVTMNGWHYSALLLFTIGFGFEAIADWQLAQFKRNPDNRGKVLNFGLWRYSRHPNYFGESMIWWSFFLFALGSGAVWTLFAPALMTLLLLKVSGVSLLEKDIGERRPGYREYQQNTSAFIPWWPKTSAHNNTLQGEQS